MQHSTYVRRGLNKGKGRARTHTHKSQRILEARVNCVRTHLNHSSLVSRKHGACACTHVREFMWACMRARTLHTFTQTVCPLHPAPPLFPHPPLHGTCTYTTTVCGADAPSFSASIGKHNATGAESRPHHHLWSSPCKRVLQCTIY